MVVENSILWFFLHRRECKNQKLLELFWPFVNVKIVR